MQDLKTTNFKTISYMSEIEYVVIFTKFR